MNIEFHLRAAGVLLILLSGLNLFVPRRFEWKRETAGLSLLNRQIFYVHHAFIIFTLLMFAALLLGLTRSLTEPSPLARGVLGALTLFWFARLIVQWFVYDRRLWRGHAFNTAMHFLFTGLWVYFTATFAAALWMNFRG